jgi:hypothetical protein
MADVLTRADANSVICAALEGLIDPTPDGFDWVGTVDAIERFLVPSVVRFARNELDMPWYDGAQALSTIYTGIRTSTPRTIAYLSEADDVIAALKERATRVQHRYNGVGDPHGWLWRERLVVAERTQFEGRYTERLDNLDAELEDVAVVVTDNEGGMAALAAATAGTMTARGLTPTHLIEPVRRAVHSLVALWPTDRSHDNSRRTKTAALVPELTNDQVDAVDLLVWGSRTNVNDTSLFYAHLKDASYGREFNANNWLTHLPAMREYQRRMHRPTRRLATT